jgi:hypothetical protein
LQAGLKAWPIIFPDFFSGKILGILFLQRIPNHILFLSSEVLKPSMSSGCSLLSAEGFSCSVTSFMGP